MENVKKCPPRLPLTKCMVASFAVGLLLCATNASAADELARSVYSTNLTQQNNQVSGRVVDSNGEPLIGVSVVEKGNKGNGAVTDVDGNFTLRVSPKSTLLISTSRRKCLSTVAMPLRLLFLRMLSFSTTSWLSVTVPLRRQTLPVRLP